MAAPRRPTLRQARGWSSGWRRRNRRDASLSPPLPATPPRYRPSTGTALLVVAAGPKAAAPPEGGGFVVDRLDDQRAPADESGGRARCGAARARATPSRGPAPPIADRSRAGRAEGRARDSAAGRCAANAASTRERSRSAPALKSGDPIRFVRDHHHGEAVALVGERPRPQPVVERRLAAGEGVGLMMRGDRFGRRQHRGRSAFRRRGFPRRRPLQRRHHFGRRLGGRRYRRHESGKALLAHAHGAIFQQRRLGCAHRGFADEIRARTPAQTPPRDRSTATSASGSRIESG